MSLPQRVRARLAPAVKGWVGRYAALPGELRQVGSSVDGLSGRMRAFEWGVDERLARLEPLVEELVDAVRSVHSETEQRAQRLVAGEANMV